MNEFNPYARYNQQMILRGFGEPAQQKLKHARVFVAGAGGLGCAALQYLAAAGIGTIGIADDDVVQVGNLHRQVLYTMQDVGALKADIAASWLMKMNPETEIHVYPVRLNSGNIADIIADYDVILDGTDNRETKYLINDACVSAGKPLVFAAISQYEGQLAIFNYPPGSPGAANYRDFFPEDSSIEPSCEETGVLGVLPGIIGCMQCNETIKLITGTGKPLVNRLLVYNALTNQVNEFFITPERRNTENMMPDKPESKITGYETGIHGSTESLEIRPAEFSQLINRENITVVDVRENGHRLSPADFQHIHIPFSELQVNLPLISGDTIITFCERGILSLHAAKMLRDAFGSDKKIFSLQKGINFWNLAYRHTGT
jgi:molybdopterin/thiamine biosynthesis adenylyltransferase/rhodanese-related sulfurtransferase